jgi:hypothetical protein
VRSSLLSFVLLLAWTSASAKDPQASLPKVKFPESFAQCAQDEDCAVAGDSCRSCGKLIVLNKKFLQKFNEMDQKARRKKRMTRACEACSTKNVALTCVQNRCRQADK